MTSQLTQQKSKHKVLVLGSNSFIAKNIISKIFFKKIYCVQKKKTKQFNKKNSKYFYFDLLDHRKLKNVIDMYDYDKIILCASNNNNSNNLNKNNIDIFSENTNILLNVLELLKYKKKIKIVNFSSIEIKKKKQSMYSISKKINYQLCNFYNTNYNLKIKNLNLPNVFGENDLNFNRIIPFLVKNIFFKKKFLIKKKKNKITFIYIDDLLKVLVDDRKKLRNTYLISIHELKIKISNFMNLKENLQRNNFKYHFDFNLYKTINWYKCYFKKKNESCNISRG